MKRYAGARRFENTPAKPSGCLPKAWHFGKSEEQKQQPILGNLRKSYWTGDLSGDLIAE